MLRVYDTGRRSWPLLGALDLQRLGPPLCPPDPDSAADDGPPAHPPGGGGGAVDGGARDPSGVCPAFRVKGPVRHPAPLFAAIHGYESQSIRTRQFLVDFCCSFGGLIAMRFVNLDEISPYRNHTQGSSVAGHHLCPLTHAKEAQEASFPHVVFFRALQGVPPAPPSSPPAVGGASPHPPAAAREAIEGEGRASLWLCGSVDNYWADGETAAIRGLGRRSMVGG